MQLLFFWKKKVMVLFSSSFQRLGSAEVLENGNLCGNKNETNSLNLHVIQEKAEKHLWHSRTMAFIER